MYAIKDSRKSLHDVAPIKRLLTSCNATGNSAEVYVVYTIRTSNVLVEAIKLTMNASIAYLVHYEHSSFAEAM